MISIKSKIKTILIKNNSQSQDDSYYKNGRKIEAVSKSGTIGSDSNVVNRTKYENSAEVTTKYNKKEMDNFNMTMSGLISGLNDFKPIVDLVIKIPQKAKNTTHQKL